MKCTQCGNEFSGNFCSQCGTKCQIEGNNAPQQQFTQPTPYVSAKPQKKKKPFYFKWWFIAIVIIAIGVGTIVLGGRGDKIKWSDMVLGEMLPEPPANRGDLYQNNKDKLSLDLDDVSAKEYSEYVGKCMENFNVDEKSNSDSFVAYNGEGYKLTLYYYDHNGELSIDLESPIEMTALKWPSSKAGKLLPAPKSTIGKFSSEYDDSFSVYVGDTTKSDYDDYVEVCSKKGFNVDYNKDDTYYSADNSDGWSLSLEYKGNNIMYVDIDAPSESESEVTPATDETEAEETDETKASESETPKKDDVADDEIRDDFKKAMDSYEEFMTEYVDFMVKYQKNPSNVKLIGEYASYMKKYNEMISDFEKWDDDKEMTTAEVAYYLDVQTRVNKKLLEIS